MLDSLRCAIDWPGTISFLKDLATGGAAIFAAYIGWRGLTTWERQSAGQQDHELARKLLVNAYSYRDSIRHARRPIMFGSELAIPPADRAEAMSDDQKRFFGLRGAYIARLKAGEDAWAAIQPDLLQAEALWGEDVKSRFRALLKLDNELRSFIEAHLAGQDPDLPEFRKESYIRLNRNRRDILYDIGSLDEPDDYDSDLRNVVAEIEAELRPRLLRRDARPMGREASFLGPLSTRSGR